jgi:hypothetical protein
VKRGQKAPQQDLLLDLWRKGKLGEMSDSNATEWVTDNIMKPAKAKRLASAQDYEITPSELADILDDLPRGGYRKPEKIKTPDGNMTISPD